MTPRELGETIRQAREKQGLSWADLSRRCRGKSASTDWVSRVEDGGAQSLSELAAALDALGLALVVEADVKPDMLSDD